MITFTLNDGSCLNILENTTIAQFIKDRDDAKDIYAVVINGKLHDLEYKMKEGGNIHFIYSESEIGKMIYERTLNFVFIAAVNALYEHAIVRMEHALSSGQYCEVERSLYLTPYDVDNIKKKMDELIQNKEQIIRKVVDTKTAVKHFELLKMYDKASLLKSRKSKQSSIYQLHGYDNYFYGIMLPNTSYITHYSIRFHAPGIWLSPNHEYVDQRKLFKVFQQNERWGKQIGVTNVAQLNQKIENGQMDEIVLMSEAMMEKQLTEMATYIVKERPLTKFILIAGPSSAGKTTFSKRLSIHLKILGLEPFPISMDDFYKSREDTPRLADGSYDFESVETVDLDLFNNTMLNLLHHTPVQLPRFNFKEGRQEKDEKFTVLDEKQILIIEGIHGLNPLTSRYLPDEAKFKIYINALTHLNLDEHNRIPTSDYRLIRRIVRDHQSRGWSASETISFWKNVKDGEDKYIYPYQESADYIFNTSMVYELAVLKSIAIPLLCDVKHNEPQFLEANRLKKLLAYFIDGESIAIPHYSILAEFIGNSVFHVA